MTQFVTTYDFMTTSANEAGQTTWANVGNILTAAGSTSANFAANGTIYKLQLTGPKAAQQIPGGFPLLSSVQILEINTEIRARLSNSLSKEVEVIITGADSIQSPNIRVSGNTFATYTNVRTIAEWGLTPQEVSNFLSGVSRAELWVPNQSGTVSGTLYVETLKFQVRYEYTGKQIAPLRLF